MASAEMYKQILVWKRLPSDEAVVYVCFERMSDGKACVQNAEFFKAAGPKDQWDRLQVNSGELFLDDELNSRSGWHESLREAIETHEHIFSVSR